MILWRIIIHFTFLLPWITVWKVLLFSKNLGFLFFISLFNFQCSGAALVSDSSKSISYLLSLVKTFFKLFSSFFKSFFAPVPMPSLLSLFQTRSAFPSLICVPYFITLLPLLSTPFSTFFILFFTLCTPSRAFVGSHTLNYTISCIPLLYLLHSPIYCTLDSLVSLYGIPSVCAAPASGAKCSYVRFFLPFPPVACAFLFACGRVYCCTVVILPKKVALTATVMGE